MTNGETMGIDLNCAVCGQSNEPPHACPVIVPSAPTLAARAKPTRFTTRAGRQMTSLAQHFRDAGLDWRADFARAIRARNYRLVQIYMKLMPYLLTGKATTKASKAWGGTRRKLTRAALDKLAELEGKGL